MEMAGTLMGATIHGLIVSGAHGSQRCEEDTFPGQVAVAPSAARLYSTAAAVVAVTYPVCSGLLCLGVKERPDPSATASGQGLSFLSGLCLTVRHPPYLKLVISFLFISAAVQVPPARQICIGLAVAILTLHTFRFSFSSPPQHRGTSGLHGPGKAGARRREWSLWDWGGQGQAPGS